MTTTFHTNHRLLGCASLALVLAMPSVADEGAESSPETVQITGIVRDFKPVGTQGGHVDFENNPENGMARYAGIVAPLIGDDGKPVFGGTGNKITSQWRDAQGRQISHLLYDEDYGDTEGSFGQAGTGGITSAESFAQWFRDVPVYNLSAPLTLTLVRQANGMYLFDDTIDPYYAAKGGFYPIDDQLFGNGAGNGNGNGGGNNDHNFHFTFEIHTEFQYDASMGQNFKFEGTDSVWLYIDGQLVNDIVGVHASHDQYVDLDRLDPLDLVDGEWYRLDFFFAQRYEPQAHFSISTNVILDSLPISTVSAVYD